MSRAPRPDVSVIMPVWRAGATIVEAAASAVRGQGVATELVLCSDDGADYRALLRGAGLDPQRIVQVFSYRAGSGPAEARNRALSAARAPVIAALDADDAYEPLRLRRVLDAMEREGLPAGTGATCEMFRGGAVRRMGRPSDGGGRLALTDICGQRIPFSPVYERTVWPHGWPLVEFAEDMVLNAALCACAGGMAFAEEGVYRYHIAADSVLGGPDAIERAARGYRQILAWLPQSPAPIPAREVIAQEIRADLRKARSAHDGALWRDVFTR